MVTPGARRRGICGVAAVMIWLPAAPAAFAQMPAASCAATIRAVIDDIAARDLDTTQGPPLNAFLTLNAAAVAEAEERDRSIAAGEPGGPLHCLPLAVKDNYDTATMPVTVGSLALMDNRPPRDAELVARLRRAGAIVVGKTNMDEFAMGIRGLSGAGGRVGNAYDPNMSPGGSSSGSGVAVGAGFVPLALGSDNCGSLRLPAVYNGAVSLRPTYGRFSTDGVFPIGFVNGTTGLIAKDTAMLRRGLPVLDDGWRSDVADAEGALRGKRIGVLRRLNGKDPWAAADVDTRARVMRAIAVMKEQGADIIDPVAIAGFDDRLGIEFLKGFAPKVDAKFASYAAPRRNWRDVCTSGLIRPEWTAKQCIEAGAPSPARERVAIRRIASNRERLTALMDRLKLDAIVYPPDGRGAARADVSRHITCYLAGSTGLPSAAAPIGVDARGMPIGLEWLGRPGSDEMLVALMAAFEKGRGKLPAARRPPANPALSAIPPAAQNSLRLKLGEAAFRSRKGEALGDLQPARFRALTDATIRAWQGP
jgi:Asp-tRNA(Asn)/Glu-tRNA(Gln) amidotransferase A subunit family amidase